MHEILYFHEFLEKYHFFIFRLKNKIIFLENRNTIFPDYTREITFQSDFLRNTIFSEHIEKKKNFFSHSVLTATT